MANSFKHQFFGSTDRVSQPLRNDRCQNILYKAVFEHGKVLKWIAALLLTSKSFQNSSFGANFVVNFFVDHNSIGFVESLLSPSSCFSLQFVPSLHIKLSMIHSEKIKRGFSDFVGELLNTKYLRLSLRSLTLQCATTEVLSSFFSNTWPQLQDLALGSVALNEAVLEMISKNALQLRSLQFDNNEGITVAGLEIISTLSSITFLDLSRCRNITDAGLEHVSKFSNITSLDLFECRDITGAGLEHISKLARITSLNLSWCCQITDSGLQFVSELSGITKLDLSSCFFITDAGVEHLSKLSRITYLDLCDCDKITPAANAKLRASLPNCTILD